jgi:hypothetical protein
MIQLTFDVLKALAPGEEQLIRYRSVHYSTTAQHCGV